MQPLIQSTLREERASDEAVQQLRAHVASTGFDLASHTRVGRRAANARWQGRILTGAEQLPSADAHYLRHVVAGGEWPSGTTLSDYVDDLRAAILNPDGGILVEEVFGTLRLTFFSPSGERSGPNGGEWIVVGYSVDYGYWTTGFQLPGRIDAYLSRAVDRYTQRWLREPTPPRE